MLGPFRLLVLVDDDLLEQTAVYFYLVKGADGKLSTHFCQDALGMHTSILNLHALLITVYCAMLFQYF